MSTLGVEGCEQIRAGTLHSLCFSILRSTDALAVHERIPRTLIQVKRQGGFLGFEYGPMLADIGDAFGDVRARIRLIRAYEAAWARQQHQEPGAAATDRDEQFEQTLVAWLTFHRAMLIGELVPETLRYLQANPAAPELDRFDRVIVDEYQDLNKAEQTILDLLGTNGSLMIVGDEDQSIYGFRHANPEGITDFSNRHDGTIDLELAQCRRCGQRIVTAANNLIRRNHPNASPPFTGMEVDPERPPGEIDVIQWQDLNSEIEGIANYVRHLVTTDTFAPGDILIMTPRRRIGYQIRNLIRRHGIEAHSFFHEEALESAEAQEAFTALTLLADNEDRVALRFWLGFGSQTWLQAQYARLRAYCEESGDSPWQAMQKIDAGELSSVGYRNLLGRFRALRARLAQLEPLTGDLLVEALFPAGSEWADPIREIISGSTIDHLTGPAELLDLVRDYVTRPEVPINPAFVRIMSLHAAKGLTAQVAIITTVVNSLIPYEDSTLIGVAQLIHMREQRRLFYVAMTRGRNTLVISSPLRITGPSAVQLRITVGNNGRTHPSRFIEELGLPRGIARSGAAWVADGYSAT